MDSSLVEKMKELLKERRKNKIQLKINFAFSTLTVFIVSYLFIYPAIATTIGFDINKDSLNSLELTTTSSVYIEEENISSIISSEQFKNHLTTTASLLPEFSSRDTLEREILTQNLISDLAVFPLEEISEMVTEPEGLPHILNEDGYITGFFVDGKTQNEDEAIEILNASVMDWEICYQLPKGTLKEGLQKRNTLVYVMDQMRTYSYKEGKILLRETQQNGEEKLTELGVFKIGKDGKEDPSVPEEYKTQEDKVFLIFNDEAVRRNEMQDFMNGRLGFRSGMLLMQEEEPIKIKVSDTMGALLKSGNRMALYPFRNLVGLNSNSDEIVIESMEGRHLGGDRFRYTIEINVKNLAAPNTMITISNELIPGNGEYMFVYKKYSQTSQGTPQFIKIKKISGGAETNINYPAPTSPKSSYSIIVGNVNKGDRYTVEYDTQIEFKKGGAQLNYSLVNKLSISLLGGQPINQKVHTIPFERKTLELTSSLQEDNNIRWVLKVDTERDNKYKYLYIKLPPGADRNRIHAYRGFESEENEFTPNFTTVGSEEEIRLPNNMMVFVYHSPPPSMGTVTSKAALIKSKEYIEIPQENSNGDSSTDSNNDSSGDVNNTSSGSSGNGCDCGGGTSNPPAPPTVKKEISPFDPGFKGDKIVVESTFGTPIQPSTTDITLKKQWQNAQGENIEKESGSVTFILKRKDQEGIIDTGFSKSFTLTPATNWKAFAANLPLKSEDGTKNYQYFVQEVQNLGEHYEVIGYSDNQQGVTGGELIVTNREKWVARLPETGGRGRKIHYIIGFGLTSLAAITRLLHRQSVDKNRTMGREGV